MNLKNRSVTLPRSLFSLLTTPTFIDHLELAFVADRPPPSRVLEQVALPAAASACTQGAVLAAP
ncbi:hypothetical protein D4R89_06420 [bacterium]|nr:MAG: hypothetical protein D4R89_06420 [bacterium]